MLVEHCLTAEDAAEKATILRLSGSVDASELNAFRFVRNQMDIAKETDLAQLMSALREKCEAEQKSAVVLLDGFDVFCRKNQTLLYNLFDWCQKSSYICVIGLTTRLDCIELLEKRVKSRMNQTIIHLTSPFQTFADYSAFAVQQLEALAHAPLPSTLQASNKKNSSKKKSASASAAASLRKQTPKRGNLGESTSTVALLPAGLSAELKQLYSKTKSICELKRYLISFLAESQSNCNASENNGKQQQNRGAADKTCAYLSYLSFLELSVLLLAAKYATNKNETTFNCNCLMASLHEIPTQMSITKDLLWKVVNKLADAGLLVICHSSKSALYLTDWTSLMLNVEHVELKEMLSAYETSLPAKLKQLLSIN